MEEINCWEFKKCGREPGGRHAQDLGICPVTVDLRLDGINNGINAGRCCWLVAGTMSTRVRGTFAREMESCLLCDFYQGVEEDTTRAEDGQTPFFQGWLRP